MVNIIFPMAGKSSRFWNAGYSVPKFMLKLHDVFLFDAVLNGFRTYFDQANFIFVTQSNSGHSADFVQHRCRALGLTDEKVEILNLTAGTSGQAETVYLGLGQTRFNTDDQLTIFNIDTIRREFRFPYFLNQARTDGYIEVFTGDGDHWSFVEVDESGIARRVAEKQRISNLCSTGLYYFRTGSLFINAYRATLGIDAEYLQGGERYVAPLYNELIGAGLSVRVDHISREQVAFAGTPSEYEHLRTQWSRDDLMLWTGL